MAKKLSKTGIQLNQPVLPFQVSQSVDAFTGADDYDISIIFYNIYKRPNSLSSLISETGNGISSVSSTGISAGTSISSKYRHP